MPKRKAMPKSLRFEVLKRDCFTCQYCGASAPEAILEVDHIIPVSNSGTNDILNLITSCRDCNRGKSKKLLSDETIVRKQKKQQEEIQKRREMIELMAQWKKELLEESEHEIDMIEDAFRVVFSDVTFTNHGRNKIRAIIKRFGFQAAYEATEISIAKYTDTETAFNKIGGVCYNKSIGRTADYYE